ncbi:MAG: OmpA family protein [Gammaproteobacteria bacterium]|nr:OmpA family protein [Gammaproteobacteria bacterium]
MIIRILPLVVTASALLAVQSAAVAQDYYIAPSVVYTDDDKDRGVDDGVSGGQVAFGKYATDAFALEGVLGSHSLDGRGELDLWEIGVNGRFVFSRESVVSPYLLLGFGMLYADPVVQKNDTSGFHTIGAGLDFGLGDGPLSLRLEYRLRESGENGGEFSDQIGSLGFSYAFGAAAPVPAPAPVRDPDSDGDGVNDSRDDCPNTPAGHRVDARGCSLDTDGDGVVDADDQCPNTYRGAAVDARGCELDGDADGVVNRLDECPNTAAGVRVDIKGCEITEVINLPGVNFETNSDRLLPGADNVLRDAAATLKKYPDMVVEVAGHTDSAGAAAYNQGLSERRAATVRDYLLNAGVAAVNLSARGYGEGEPVADNATAEGRARNRRVELRIIRQ